MSLSCVLFDLDGTLVDTAPDFITVLNNLRQQNNLQPLAAAEIRRTVSGGAREMVKLGFGGAPGEPQFDQYLQEFLAGYGDCVYQNRSEAKLFDGFGQLLDELVEKNLPWGIVTNKPERFSVALLQTLALEPAVLICPDHVSQAKPSPEPLLLACQKLGLESQTAVYVGDHERDIQAGRSANMATIVVRWGYYDEPDPAQAWGADYLAETPDHLRELLHTLQ